MSQGTEQLRIDANVRWRDAMIDLKVQQGLALPVTVTIPAAVWLRITAAVMAGMADRMGQPQQLQLTQEKPA